MKITKRNGSTEMFSFDKVLKRIQKMSDGLNDKYIDCYEIAKRVFDGIYDGITTAEIDELAAEISSTLATRHHDYARLGGRIAMTLMKKSIPRKFSTAMRKLAKQGTVRNDVVKFIKENWTFIDELVESRYDDDLNYDYFAVKAMQKSYLLKDIDTRKPLETPHFMFMRVAIELWYKTGSLDDLKDTFEQLSNNNMIHASPTLFNSCTPMHQLSSCFLISTVDDSVEGLADTIKKTMQISKTAGGIGLHSHNIRNAGSYINGTGGESNGKKLFYKTLNEVSRWINQGGKRKGAFAMYDELHYWDILEIVKLKLNSGAHDQRARDLFYAMWVSDLFMERVNNNEEWTMFCPNTAKGLEDVYGDEYTKLYTHYENTLSEKDKKTISARKLFSEIVSCQIETGMPYMLYKDASNLKSNQKNIGTIKSSNLCAEILEYSSPDETAVCNLVSVVLHKFVDLDTNGEIIIHYDKIKSVISRAVKNLDVVIDRTKYPTECSERSNLRHRPMGIGVQGLADMFFKLNLAFDSDKANEIQTEIFAAMYYYGVSQSVELAKRYGAYETFDGSPASKGQFQFDLWGETPSKTFNWELLREDMMKFGMRNSLLFALMPTAGTSQLLGNVSAFEPITSNIESRRTLSGDFVVLNKWLVNDLDRLGLWSDDMKTALISNRGSVQHLPIPTELKDKYKTAYEISQRVIIDMASSRGKYICQTQSMNLFVETPTSGKITSMHFYGWKKGLKTGMYYLRSKAATAPQQFTLDVNTNGVSCSLDNPDGCISCGS